MVHLRYMYHDSRKIAFLENFKNNFHLSDSHESEKILKI